MDIQLVKIVTESALARWLLEEINGRHMSIRKFASEAGLTHGTLNNLLSAPDGSYPKVETLIQLARYTHTDLCTLVSLVAPDVTSTSARARVIADRIERLPLEKQDIVDRYLIGLGFKSGDERE